MAGQGNAAPVIIKRKKVIAGGGHHGGAWKVAYADFVTAMMAFFLLMWLLNATSEQQRQGIADYFNPIVTMERVSGGGDGPFGGDSIHADAVMAQTGTGAAVMLPPNAGSDAGASGDTAAEQKVLKDLKAALQAIGGESMEKERLMRHVVTRLTDEGLVVELFDLPDSPLFEEGTAIVRPVLRELVAVVVGVFNLAANRVAVHGSVMSYPITLIENPVWTLSTARAQAARVLLEQVSLDPARLHRVAGLADRNPAVHDVGAARNNRLEIILLRYPR